MTPGEGQVRALITIAGNPALSAPNGDQLNAALATLEFMVSVDCYLNETTRHADVILPPPALLERAHYDLAFYQLSIRNVAHYSPPVFPRAPGTPDEWELLLRLTGIISGQGAGCDIDALDGLVAHQLIAREVHTRGSRVEGRDPTALLAALAPRRGPERLLDFLLRTGPYGDAFGAHPDGLTLARLEEVPCGVDLGPLQPRVPEVLRTPTGKIELAPPLLLTDVERLRACLQRPRPPLVLIGRRELRSNNSWMHNLHVLVKGDEQCTLLVHPDDAMRLGLADGASACIASEASSVAASVRVTEAIMPGVVSLPHGWGHGLPGARLRIAAEHAGVSINRLIPTAQIEPLSGNAILSATAVEVRPAD
jgi:anaerobic selenocysteine-containing dehydrogenase